MCSRCISWAWTTARTSTGLEAQPAALADVDGLLGEFLEAYRAAGLLEGTLAVVVSDHGQIDVIPDDRHSLRLSFPFDREMGYLFDALGLDVHDKPGEDPNCDAVVAINGGLAHVYLQHREGNWADLPRFQADVLRAGMAFWEANLTGQHAPDLQGALCMVLARDAEAEGWQAGYRALTPEGGLVEVGEFLAAHPEIETVEAVQRLERLAGPLSGDLLLVSNYAGGFYFANPMPGVHGGLHPQDSLMRGFAGLGGGQRPAGAAAARGGAGGGGGALSGGRAGARQPDRSDGGAGEVDWIEKRPNPPGLFPSKGRGERPRTNFSSPPGCGRRRRDHPRR